MENEQPHPLFGLSIDDEGTGTLRTACQWSRVLAILGFVLAVCILLLGFIMYNKILGSYSVNTYGSNPFKAVALRYLITCILVAAVFITGAVFTSNFASRMSTAIATSDQESLNKGLAAIKNLVIFWAVIMILFIVLLLLAFIGLASV